MLLTADVGNTTVALGGFCGPDLAFVHRLPTRRDMDAAGWTAALAALLDRAGCPAPEVEGTALSSVVPAVTRPLSAALTALTGRPVLTVDRTTPPRLLHPPLRPRRPGDGPGGGLRRRSGALGTAPGRL